MKQRAHILLFLVLLIPFSTKAETEVEPHEVPGQIQAIKGIPSPSAYPPGLVRFFAFHHETETPPDSLNKPATALSETNSEDDTNNGFSGIPYEIAVSSIYLIRCRTIHRSLRIRTILFPFHSFL
ncbi:hypothetical protein SAMN06265218_1226 [Fodinibius sediminis]|uniref:Uncharacterized protein n=1 Tax=Fodinibius sediminis TaxID=1214077 RepID=A0A521F2S7_9BACT|nr:hypothetical protein SAMN06265218_1226 [Fodinibius sediminis]